MRKFLLVIMVAIVLVVVETKTVPAQDSGVTNLVNAVAAARAADSSLLKEQAQLSAEKPVDKNGNTVTHEQLKADYIADTNQKALSVAVDLIDLDFSNNKCQYLLAKQSVLVAKLQQAQAALQTGNVLVSDVSNIQMQVNQNASDLKSYQMLVSNDKQIYETLTGQKLADKFDFSSCYFIIDAAKLPSPLPNVGDNSTTTPLLIDSTEMPSFMNDAVNKFSKLGDSIGTYIQTSKALSDAQTSFAIGKVDQATVTTASDASEDARIASMEDKANYSKSLYTLDCSLQGYLSTYIKKPTDGSIFISSSNIT